MALRNSFLLHSADYINREKRGTKLGICTGSASRKAQPRRNSLSSYPVGSHVEIKKPSSPRGLKNGAGEEGRTPDLMLGKHTL